MIRENIKYRANLESAGWRHGDIKIFTGDSIRDAQSENYQNSSDQKKHCLIEINEKIKDINNKHDLLNLPDDKYDTIEELYENKKNNNNEAIIGEFQYELIWDEKSSRKVFKVTRIDPVKIIIKKYEINTDELEEVDETKEHLEACLLMEESSKNNKNEKDISEIKEAIEVLSKDKISILQISDYNTNGARFPDQGFSDLNMIEKSSYPWYAILYGTGVRAKDGNPDNLGSHGVGKIANFRLSAPRMVLYRSRYAHINNCFSCKEKIMEAFGGRIINRAHEINGEEYGHTSWIGKEIKVNNKDIKVNNVEDPYRDSNEFPNFVNQQKSNETGLDIFIVGFNGGDDWEYNSIISLLCKFQIPILKGKLIVEIANRVIDKSTIDELYDNEEIKNYLEDSEDNILIENFNNAKWYYELFKRDPENYTDDKYKSKVETFENKAFGKFEVRYLVKDEKTEAEKKYPLNEINKKSLGWFRQKMFVTNKPKIIGGINLNKFPPFYASVECLSPKGIKVFTDRENPKHDDFELLINDEYKHEFPKLRKELLKNLEKWILGPSSSAGDTLTELNELMEGNESEGNKENDISNQRTGEILDKEKKKEKEQENTIVYLKKRTNKQPNPKPKPRYIPGEDLTKIIPGTPVKIFAKYFWRDDKEKNKLHLTISVKQNKGFRGRVAITTVPMKGLSETISINEAFYKGSKLLNGSDWFEDYFQAEGQREFIINSSDIQSSRVFNAILTNMDGVLDEDK